MNLKTEGPCNLIEYLGLYLNSIQMERRLLKVKFIRTAELLETFHLKYKPHFIFCIQLFHFSSLLVTSIKYIFKKYFRYYQKRVSFP